MLLYIYIDPTNFIARITNNSKINCERILLAGLTGPKGEQVLNSLPLLKHMVRTLLYLFSKLLVILTTLLTMLRVQIEFAQPYFLFFQLKIKK